MTVKIVAYFLYGMNMGMKFICSTSAMLLSLDLTAPYSEWMQTMLRLAMSTSWYGKITFHNPKNSRQKEKLPSFFYSYIPFPSEMSYFRHKIGCECHCK